MQLHERRGIFKQERNSYLLLAHHPTMLLGNTMNQLSNPSPISTHQNNPYCQEKIYQQLYKSKLNQKEKEEIKNYKSRSYKDICKKIKKDQTQLYMQRKKEEGKKAIIELLHLYNRVFAWLSSTRKLICLVRDVFQNMF